MSDNSIDLTMSYAMGAKVICAVIEQGATPTGKRLACDEIIEWGALLDKAGRTIAAQRKAMEQALFALETLINLQGINELIPYAKILRNTLEGSK